MCHFYYGAIDGTDMSQRALFCGTWPELLEEATQYVGQRELHVYTIQQCFRGVEFEDWLHRASLTFLQGGPPSGEERTAS